MGKFKKEITIQEEEIKKAVAEFYKNEKGVEVDTQNITITYAPAKYEREISRSKATLKVQDEFETEVTLNASQLKLAICNFFNKTSEEKAKPEDVMISGHIGTFPIEKSYVYATITIPAEKEREKMMESRLLVAKKNQRGDSMQTASKFKFYLINTTDQYLNAVKNTVGMVNSFNENFFIEIVTSLTHLAPDMGSATDMAKKLISTCELVGIILTRATGYQETMAAFNAVEKNSIIVFVDMSPINPTEDTSIFKLIFEEVKKREIFFKAFNNLEQFKEHLLTLLMQKIKSL